jgi:hypothetical protein
VIFRIWTVGSGSDGLSFIPIRKAFDLIVAIALGLNGLDRSIPLRGVSFAKEPLCLFETNPRSTGTVHRVLETLAPRPLRFLGNEAQSRAHLKRINELVNVFLIQK